MNSPASPARPGRRRWSPTEGRQHLFLVWPYVHALAAALAALARRERGHLHITGIAVDQRGVAAGVVEAAPVDGQRSDHGVHGCIVYPDYVHRGGTRGVSIGDELDTVWSIEARYEGNELPSRGVDLPECV
jgi:hypothetical protein